MQPQRIYSLNSGMRRSPCYSENGYPLEELEERLETQRLPPIDTTMSCYTDLCPGDCATLCTAGYSGCTDLCGCDGAKSGRNYYTEFAEAVPKDCAILTLACGKYRFNKLDFGDIGGIPRLLDCGQCNDAYSAIKVAVALAQAFGCGVNDLPLSLILSWYEQKACAILLTLLYLGIKDIRLGPSLPAFVSPNVLNVLVEKFDIKPITTVEADLKAALSAA